MTTAGTVAVRMSPMVGDQNQVPTSSTAMVQACMIMGAYMWAKDSPSVIICLDTRREKSPGVCGVK